MNREIQTAKLIFDTGCNRTIFNEAFLRGLGYEPSGDVIMRVYAAGSVITDARPYTLRALHLLHPANSESYDSRASVKDYVAYAYSLPNDLPADGLLGLDLITKFDTGLQFLNGDQGVLYLSPSDRHPSPREISHIQVVPASREVTELLKVDFTRIYELDPNEFEALIYDRFMAMGYGVTRVGGVYHADGGVDMIAYPNGRTPFPFLIAVQAKHHRLASRKTDALEVRKLRGVASAPPFDAKVLVTNTGFTRQAIVEANACNDKVGLRDGVDIFQWVNNNFSTGLAWQEFPTKVTLGPNIVVRIPCPGAAGGVAHTE